MAVSEVIAPTVSKRRRSKLRSALANLLLLFVGILVALLLMEIVLRFYNPFQARIKGDRLVLVTNKTYHIKNNVIKASTRK